ncbi:hypothetical protein DVH24_016804 [Malus domestica]|uniref:MAGE domain-containing protein n=1 Tax=Malus domestica TaxID=3750 RepID=A0A498HVF7_MALDO|nr:hypothetical protein DVH24_016804 [Malus domestica]
MSQPVVDLSHFDISKEEKDEHVAEVIRYVLFKTHHSSGCPIKREDLTQLLTKNYHQRNLPTSSLPFSGTKCGSFRGLVLLPLTKDAFRNKAKSYCITSKLPSDVYKKYVFNDNDHTVPLNGFIFVILSLVHISGGKMTEGMAAFWFYLMAIRSAMLYGIECWAVKHQHVHKMGVAEMRMLRWRCGLTRKDKIRNEWVGHVQRRPIDAPVRRCDYGTEVQGRRGRGRPRKTLEETLRKDLEYLDLTKDMTQNRAQWQDLWRNLTQMGSDESNENHPVLGNIKQALDTLVRQRYLQKDKLAERALGAPFSESTKAHIRGLCGSSLLIRGSTAFPDQICGGLALLGSRLWQISLEVVKLQVEMSQSSKKSQPEDFVSRITEEIVSVDVDD